MIFKNIIITFVIILFACQNTYSKEYDNIFSSIFKECRDNNLLSISEQNQCYEDEHNRINNELNLNLSKEIYNNSKINLRLRNAIQQNQEKWIVVHNEMNSLLLEYSQIVLGNAGIRLSLDNSLNKLVERVNRIKCIINSIYPYIKIQNEIDSNVDKIMKLAVIDQYEVYKSRDNQILNKIDNFLKQKIYKNSKINPEYKNSIQKNQTKWLTVHNEINDILFEYGKYEGTAKFYNTLENSLLDAEERYKWIQTIEENISSYLEMQEDMPDPKPEPQKRPERSSVSKPNPAPQSKTDPISYSYILSRLEYDDVLIGSLSNYKVVRGEYFVDFNEVDEWHFHGSVDNSFHSYLQYTVNSFSNGENLAAVLFSMDKPVAVVPVFKRQLYIQPGPVLRKDYAVIGVCEPETDDCWKLRIFKANPQYEQVTKSLPGHEAVVFVTEGGEMAACYPEGN